MRVDLLGGPKFIEFVPSIPPHPNLLPQGGEGTYMESLPAVAYLRRGEGTLLGEECTII